MNRQNVFMTMSTCDGGSRTNLACDRMSGYGFGKLIFFGGFYGLDYAVQTWRLEDEEDKELDRQLPKDFLKSEVFLAFI
jgi:hypothetical protein